MYLVDTDVISNARKRTGANPGVRRFFRDAATQGIPLFLSAIWAVPATLVTRPAPNANPRTGDSVGS
jgi:hypothetical protein